MMCKLSLSPLEPWHCTTKEENFLIPVEDVTGKHGETLTSEQDVLSSHMSKVDTLHTCLQQANEEITMLKIEIPLLKMQLSHSKAQIKKMWCNNCKCLGQQDNKIALRDAEIAQLRQQLQQLRICQKTMMIHSSQVYQQLNPEGIPAENPLLICSMQKSLMCC